jgi:F-type H+-transporting ATPase subunit delta
MDAGAISSRYARAIYAYAAEKGDETALYKNMHVLITNFSIFPALREVVNNPTVSAGQKISVLTTACGIHADETLKQVVRMVVTNKRANYMENIARMYDVVYRKAKNLVVARLITIDPATEKTKEALMPVISQVTDGQIEFHTATDPDIIGGFILEIEDKRLDASVKHQLNKLKQDARY